jgi:cytochrome c nitrite reductase small subunit
MASRSPGLRAHVRSWITVALGICAGAAAGIGGFTFVYAKGWSYLTDDPAACANCHVMREQHDGWLKSSHHTVATCNDCHTPAGFLAKYATKAENGFWHSFHFTAHSFPDPIRIRPESRSITEQACRRCHGEMAAALDGVQSERASCLHCHDGIGHPEGTPPSAPVPEDHINE